MTSSLVALKSALRSPLLPFWLVIALLPFARSSELGTVLCTVGSALFFMRHPHALQEHAGARLLLWVLAAYVLAALISALDSLAPLKSWETTAALLRFAPLGLYVCFAARYADRLTGLYLAVAIVVTVWAIDAWIQALTGWSLAGRAQAERITGIFGAANPKLGPTLAVLSPFVLDVARRYRRVPGLIGAFLLLLGPVLLAGSRAAWLCYALVALAFAVREIKSWRHLAWLLAGAVLISALALALAWKTSSRFDARMERTLTALQGTSQGIDTALTGRLDIWQASVRMIQAHPVNGVGVRAFRYAYPQFAPAGDHFLIAETCGVNEGACHAHQLVLEILTETGGIGLLLWLAGAGVALRGWRRASALARTRAFPVMVALGVMLFPLNTHLAFYSAWWGLLFAWLLGLWCAALYAEPIAGEVVDGT